MCKLFKFALVYLFVNINLFTCADDYSEDEYDLFDFVQDDDFDRIVNLIDSDILDVTQQVDNLIDEINISTNTVKPLESSLIPTSSVQPAILIQETNGFFSFGNNKPETESEHRKRLINQIEKQIKIDLSEYKFNKATKLTCLRKHLIIEHDRLNELERIKSYKTIESIQASLSEHISWFTNYSEHLMRKENQPVQEEFLDGNGLVDVLISIVNLKIIYPNQPYKIKKNKDEVVYSLKPFVILDATIDPKNASEKVGLIRSSPFYLKNNVDEKYYLMKGNLSLELVLNMKNKFELLYNYVFDTSIETNLIGNVEVRYFYQEFKFDITILEILDFEHFEINNNFNFFQGLIINPVISTLKPRIMEAIKMEANKFLQKTIQPLKMKYIFDIIK